MIQNDTMFDPPPPAARPPLRAVVFDLDDTLYPEEHYVLSGFRMVAQYVKNLYDLDLYDDMHSIYQAGERSNVFGASLARHFKDVEDAVLRKMAHVYWSHTPRIALFDDARICLALLISRNIRVGVITTGPVFVQRRKIKALNLDNLLDAVVYTDDLLGEKEPGRPGVDAFHIMSLQMDVELAEMAFIGDNPLTDFRVPRQLGLPTIRIRRASGDHAPAEALLPEDQPEHVVGTLDQVPALFTAAGCQAHNGTLPG